MTYELRINISIFGNAIILQIILGNEIPGNNEIKYGYQIKKKVLFQKSM